MECDWRRILKLTSLTKKPVKRFVELNLRARNVGINIGNDTQCRVCMNES